MVTFDRYHDKRLDAREEATEEKKTCKLQDGNIAEVSVVSLKGESEGLASTRRWKIVSRVVATGVVRWSPCREKTEDTEYTRGCAHMSLATITGGSFLEDV